MNTLKFKEVQKMEIEMKRIRVTYDADVQAVAAEWKAGQMGDDKVEGMKMVDGFTKDLVIECIARFNIKILPYIFKKNPKKKRIGVVGV